MLCAFFGLETNICEYFVHILASQLFLFDYFRITANATEENKSKEFKWKTLVSL